MTPGSRTRRAAFGLVAAITTLASSGCHSVPVARLAPTPNRPKTSIADVGRAAFLPATVALETPSEMSAMEPVRHGQLTEPATRLAAATPPDFTRPAADPPVETPLLDEALERAKGLEQIIIDEMTPDPTPIPPAQPEPVVITPTPTPEPAKVEPVPTPKAEPTPVAPEEAWADGVRRLGDLARAEAARPGDAAQPWEFRSRVLDGIAGPGLDRPESRDVVALLRAVEGPTASADEVRAAFRVIEGRAPLEISDLQLCLKVERFGEYEAIEPPVRRPGQQVVIYCQVDGVRHEETANGFRSRLAGQVELVPEGGSAPAWTDSLGTGEETTRYRRKDFFIPYIFTIPRSVPPGRYLLRLTERDLVAGPLGHPRGAPGDRPRLMDRRGLLSRPAVLPSPPRSETMAPSTLAHDHLDGDEPMSLRIGGRWGVALGLAACFVAGAEVVSADGPAAKTRLVAQKPGKKKTATKPGMPKAADDAMANGDGADAVAMPKTAMTKGAMPKAAPGRRRVDVVRQRHRADFSGQLRRLPQRYRPGQGPGQVRHDHLRQVDGRRQARRGHRRGATPKGVPWSG